VALDAKRDAKEMRGVVRDMFPNCAFYENVWQSMQSVQGRSGMFPVAGRKALEHGTPTTNLSEKATPWYERLFVIFLVDLTCCFRLFFHA
jgi:hypothetical protein